MAPKRKPAVAAERDPDGIFRGVSAFIVPHGVQARRLEVALFPQPTLSLAPRVVIVCLGIWGWSMQVWKQRLVQMGGRVVEKPPKGELPGFNHVLAMDAKALLRELDAAWLHRFRGVIAALFPPPIAIQALASYSFLCASCCVCAAICIWLSRCCIDLWRLRVVMPNCHFMNWAIDCRVWCPSNGWRSASSPGRGCPTTSLQSITKRN